jgi:hypothetical protein
MLRAGAVTSRPGFATLASMSMDPLATRRDIDPRLDAVVSLTEFAALARERMHPGGFDYVAGGAWDEDPAR